MNTADAILVSVSILAGILATGMCFYFQRPLAWLLGTIVWIFVGANGYRLSTTAWDTMYFLFWASLAMTIVCLLMTLQTRGMEKEEAEGEEKHPDDADSYTDEAGGYGETQERIHKATGGSRRRRPR